MSSTAPFLLLCAMTGIGRQVAVVNLDPANDGYAYNCKVDIAELIQLSEVMDYLHLGPNGGLVYCMEYLEQNADWLEQRLQSLPKETYLLFDCPGQVELYTHNKAVRGLFARLAKAGYRLAAVHLADAHYCADPGKFISVLLTSLSAMLQVSDETLDKAVLETYF
jgi:GTPase SAR1 family protein